MRGRTVTMRLEKGSVAKSEYLFQYDYGQRLKLTGVELPFSYEVHFSNSDRGESVTAIGDSTGVDIPDAMLTSGKSVHVWLFLHDTVTDGETEYQGIIGVIRRAEPNDPEPTPAQADVIAQTIAALNAAVQQVGEDSDAAYASKEAAETAQGKAEDAQTAAEAAQTAAENARDRAETAAGNAEASAAEATRQAQAAAGSAQNSANSAAAAYRDAERAEQAAAGAGFMEVGIDENGHLIYIRTDQVDADFILSDGHLILQSA